MSSAARAIRRFAWAAAAPLTLAGVLAVPAGATAAPAPCVAWTGAPPVSPGHSLNRFTGVAALSPCDVWAVGQDSDGGANQTLTEQWDGSAWTVVPSPSPGDENNNLLAVRAESASDAWAVGSFRNHDGGDQTLILHWDGTSWQQVTSPDPGDDLNDLNAVRVVSASDVWAVGESSDLATPSGTQTLIVHWDGTSWRQVPSPNPGGISNENDLNSVAATSAGSAWAVGDFFDGTAFKSLILRWNGTKWSRVTSPNPGTTGNFLGSVGATSAASAWAVGSRESNGPRQSLILRWNGTAWSRVASPSPGGPMRDTSLSSVVALSAASAWAVGDFFGGTSTRGLALHWDGTSWTRVATPNPGPSTDLAAVAATSGSNVWVVGRFFDSTASFDKVMAIHCC